MGGDIEFIECISQTTINDDLNGFPILNFVYKGCWMGGDISFTEFNKCFSQETIYDDFNGVPILHQT